MVLVALIYSIIEIAKLSGLAPFNYQDYLLEELSKIPDDIELVEPSNSQ